MAELKDSRKTTTKSKADNVYSITIQVGQDGQPNLCCVIEEILSRKQFDNLVQLQSYYHLV